MQLGDMLHEVLLTSVVALLFAQEMQSAGYDI